MNDFLPAQARPHERAVLICYHVLGITHPKDIAMTLGHASPSEVYRTLKKYRGVEIHFTGHGQRNYGSSYIAPVGLK